jgi:hypothetical protein
VNKYIDILTKVLSGKYTTDKYDIESTGSIDISLKLVDGKITILFGTNRPVVIAKYIIRLKLPIQSIEIVDDYMYIQPEGWRAIPISLKDLSNDK